MLPRQVDAYTANLPWELMLADGQALDALTPWPEKEDERDAAVAAAVAFARQCRQAAAQDFARSLTFWDAIMQPEAVLVERLLGCGLDQRDADWARRPSRTVEDSQQRASTETHEARARRAGPGSERDPAYTRRSASTFRSRSGRCRWWPRARSRLLH